MSRTLGQTVGAVLTFLSLIALIAFFRDRQAIGRTDPDASPRDAVAIAVYFTDPGSSLAPRHRGGADEALAAAIDAAEKSVDLAVYSFDLWSVRDALISVQQRGVRVRMVTESDNILAPEIEELERAGIPVIGDRRETLMHDKFVVIDGQEVWTGSMNLTVGSVYEDNNNMLRLTSPQAASAFTRQFEEMFVEDRFGPLSLSSVTAGPVGAGDDQVQVLFAPEDHVADRLLELVRSARQSLDFLAYSFTSDALGEAMMERARAGVRVRGVFEADMADALGSEFPRLREAGLDVRVDTNPGLMHHKVIIVDDRIVMTGSYNFTRSAEEGNDETILILEDPALAKEYLEEFGRIFFVASR